jgi:uncharacterized protein (DUF1697 family)
VTRYVALLRAVNVGGRKLAMADLKKIAEELGLAQVRTYIASGNLLFASRKSEASVKATLEQALAKHMNAEVLVMVRTAEEMKAVVERNPFPAHAGNNSVAIFLDEPPPKSAADEAKNVDDERVALGEREIYVAYGRAGIGESKLRIPAAKNGTGRNMNTVAKLAQLAKEER